MDSRSLEFELPNVGPGPDPLALADLAERNYGVVLLFQRDYHCNRCRRWVRTVAERYDDFRARDAEVVAVLPESRARAARWQEMYDLPYPLVADGEKAVSERYGQPLRYGAVGRLHDLIGRLPAVVVLDTTGPTPRVAHAYRGDRPDDLPAVDELVGAVDALRVSGPTAADLAHESPIASE